MKRGARREKKKKKKRRARERRGGKKRRRGREKNRERVVVVVGGWWREITRVFVVVCWSSPGYKPFIALPTLAATQAPPDRQIVLRDGMPTLFVATHT